MQSEASSGIKLTAYSCICWLFHRMSLFYLTTTTSHFLLLLCHACGQLC